MSRDSLDTSAPIPNPHPPRGRSTLPGQVAHGCDDFAPEDAPRARHDPAQAAAFHDDYQPGALDAAPHVLAVLER